MKPNLSVDKQVCYLFARTLMVGVLAFSLLSCGTCKPAPDLERLYRSAREDHPQPPVILIPGILGTRLQDNTGHEIWPGSTLKLLASRYPELALAIAPQSLPPGADDLRPAGL